MKGDDLNIVRFSWGKASSIFRETIYHIIHFSWRKVSLMEAASIQKRYLRLPYKNGICYGNLIKVDNLNFRLTYNYITNKIPFFDVYRDI